MKSAPRVTVLMTVYNGLPYLPEAIESVLQQSFTDLELLVVDDASTDDSHACIRSFRDPRIRLVRNPENMGQVRSLNKGLSLIQSPYIARMDQDDVCLPERIQSQLAYLERHPEAAACGSWLTWIDPTGRQSGVAGFQVDSFGSFVGVLLGQATPIAHPTALFRREAIQELGGYDETFSPCEDYELWCRLALRRHSVAVLRQSLLRLRIHGGQQSATRLVQQKEQARRAHERFLTPFCDQERVVRASQLLRMDPDFWKDQTGRQVAEICEEVRKITERMQERFALSREELLHLRRRVAGWLARTTFEGILRRHHQTLPAYRLAWRLGRGVTFPPSLLAYPLGLAFSPLWFPPGVREAFGTAARWLNRKRYTARMVFNGWGIR